eukprot:GGOE01062153.1.p1 GENE.GGOE01062153.1~~GGOE01062153.1.p1  ORF type:complete len:696 (-),score=169.66 GGOE01062153.1:133-1929(-)
MSKLVCHNVTQCVDGKTRSKSVKCNQKNAVPQGYLAPILPLSLNLFKHTDRRLTLQRCRRYEHEWGRYRPVAQGGAYTPGPRKCAEFYDEEPIEVEEWAFSNSWEHLGDGNQTNNDELYVGNYTIFTLDKQPVQMRLLGHNVVPSSHPDDYIFDFFYIRAVDDIDPEVFQPPIAALDCSKRLGGGGDELATAPHPTVRHPGHQELHMMLPEGHTMRREHFEQYNARFKKVHATAEARAERYRHFHRNRRYIAAFNRQQKTYWLGLNHMGDWSPEERAALRGVRWTEEVAKEFFTVADRECQHRCPRHSKPIKLPFQVDWRERHAIRWAKGQDWDRKSRGYFVTPPKDQGTCGSCWAFGSAGTLEGQIANITHNDRHGRQFPEAISEQNLMDCSWDYGNKACGGGVEFKSFQWIMEHNNGRVASERTYPYVNENSWCHYDEKRGMTSKFNFEGTTYKSKGIGNVVSWGTSAIYKCSPHCNTMKKFLNHGFRQLNTPASIQSLKEVVWQHGPVTISVDASPIDWYFYTGGVYYNPECSSTAHDHAITAAGFGTTEDGTKYWLIKNSWGHLWGEDGYIRLAEKGNICGVATAPTYVVMKEH